MTGRRRLRHVGLVLAIAWLLTGTAAYPAEAPASLTGLVTWIHDADTLEVAPHGKVRLLGVDAPEKTASDRDDKFVKLGIVRGNLRAAHGAGLAWCLHHLKGQWVRLTFDTTRQERRDRHGRLLAYVHLPDGRLLNRVLLEEGLVIVYRRFPIDLKQDFLTAEAAAQKRGAGLWAR